MGQKLDKAPRGAYDAIVYIDGSEVVAEDSEGRKIASGVAGIDDCTIISSLSHTHDTIYMLGNFSMITPGRIFITDNGCRIFGNSGLLTNIGFDVNGVDGFMLDNIRFTGNVIHSAIELYDCDNVFICRAVSNNSIGPAAGWGVFRDSPGATSTNVNHTYVDCSVFDANDFGFMAVGAITASVKNYNYIRCEAHRCGLSSRAHDYVVGIDVCEGFNVYGMNIIDCKATYNWDSGLHSEGNGIFQDVVVDNFYADHNGQKTNAIGGNGMRIGASKITNCICSNNGLGFSGTNDVGCGIKIPTITYPTIVSNNICYGNSGYGICVQNYTGSRKVIVANNVISNCLDGIVLVGPDNVGGWIVSNNAISNSVHNAMNFYALPHMCVNNNIIECGETGILSSWSDDDIFTSNQIRGTTIYGIRLRYQVDSVLYDNDIEVASGMVFFADTGVIGSILKRNRGYLTESSGSSTGTGTEQTIAHGLAAIPTGCKAWIRYPISATVYAEKEIRMDATNIYPKVKTGLVYDWRVE